MNKTIITPLAALMFFSATTAGGKKVSEDAKARIEKVSVSGYIGQRIGDCIENRVKKQNVEEITAPFLKQDEVHEMWGTEFWGKWVQGAMSSYRYTQDPDIYAMIERSEKEMMAAQLPDGYLGNYDKDHQLKGWDVWGRKYSTLGLLKWYGLSGDKKALKAACRLIDYTMTQIGEGKHHIYECGNYKGMASGSILEPVMFLYKYTKDKKYLDFAKFIVSDMEQPGGPQLIAKADVPVYKRFPVKGNTAWWSQVNGQKAYEMMSCYVGLLELYKVTHNEQYLDVVKTVVRHIMDEEINICGSGAANECWYGGRLRQTMPVYHAMETCVTFTWMQINERLLQITDNPLYADNIETTIYNALMSSMKNDASQIAKYTPLEGFRHEGEKQCGLNINCCNANGPRAFAMIPRFAYMARGKDSIDINFYAPSQMQASLGKNRVNISTATQYPVDGKIEISVDANSPTAFLLSLRIPAWSLVSKVSVNGENVGNVRPGTYCRLQRVWKKGDKVTLELDMRTRLIEQNHMQALQRGPVVLARDTRFNDGFVDETCVIQHKDGYVDARPVAAPKGIWMAFSIPAVMGTDLESFSKPVSINVCDFASAGNEWDRSQRYRVWLQKTLSAINEPQP